MDLVGYLRAVRKNWWIVAVAAAVGLMAAAGATLATVPRYASTVTFFVNTPSDTIAGSAQGDTFGQKRVNSYVQLITTSRLADLVVDDLKNGMSASAVSSEISAKADPNTVLLTATITDTSSIRSLQIASSVSIQFVALVQSIETAENTTPSAVRLEVVDGPTLNPTPVEPKGIINLALGFLIGLVIGLALAVLRDALDTTLRTVDDLRAVSGAPVMGVILFDEQAKENPLLTADKTRSIRFEAFRQLRTNLQFANAATPVQVLTVTSSVSNEGKSSTAVNLAISFAEAGLKTVLVEGDLRRPRVADYLGMEGAVGLTNVLVGQVTLAEALQPCGPTGLTLLASGSIPPNPSEMLGSVGMVELITQLRHSFDMIVIDTPPLVPVTDAAIVATFSDGTLMVVRHGSTRRVHLTSSLRSLAAVDARLLGSVMNMLPAKGIDSRAYGYAYYYDDEDNSRSRLEAPSTAPTMGNRPSSAVNTSPRSERVEVAEPQGLLK